MSNWNDHLCTEEVAYNITYHSSMMQYLVPSRQLNSYSHLGSSNPSKPQVALKTQSSHVSLTTPYGHSKTEFKSMQPPSSQLDLKKPLE